jgi:hypothetical protein
MADRVQYVLDRMAPRLSKLISLGDLQYLS